MAKLKRILVAISVLVVLACVPISECAKKPMTVARKEDIPFIKCQVCEKLAAQLHQQVKKKQAEITPKKISEYQIIEISENVCNLKKAEADWILQIDIVEQGDKLELVEQGSEGQCNSECKTIERACQENRTPGEIFVAKSAKEAEMEKIMKSMEGMPGAPGMKMYSRDELMNQNFGGEDADDEDDDDEDTQIPSKLGKVLREKESAKSDLKQRITNGILKTKETLKKHANQVSNWLRKTWRGLKKPASKKSTKANKAEL
ncbi:uncharacterized protein Pyn_31018 [Prunus yedoensis var. nudiflora]|uniref:Saposin B-type domain-containing protein n=1 Tax=Prunus yedoensis var. nudiflora TaxID=2094558 RepID=A0A314ZBH2_PRUYE|nr:uncharacterized protein Pyn_31018 [Prunus yedoensis var. nudiflora]